MSWSPKGAMVEDLNLQRREGANIFAADEGKAQSRCRKCGECCRQGGPALHGQDLELITSGQLTISCLITIRKGELVRNPLSGKVQPATVELVKIVGTGKQWQCCYYDTTRGCTIYDCRPVACSLLECWDTRKILDIIETDTLSRLDILGVDSPFAAVIEEHEQRCPCTDLERIHRSIDRLTSLQKEDLQNRVRTDLQIRATAVNDFNLSLAEELFYFGRPFFQLLRPCGVRAFESAGDIQLIW